VSLGTVALIIFVIGGVRFLNVYLPDVGDVVAMAEDPRSWRPRSCPCAPG
jgi:hypothetical protein